MDMTEQSITIELERFVDFGALEENVIRELAKTCESKMTGGHTKSFHSMCVEAIEKAISDRISARVSELLERPISMRDRFGDPLPGAEEKTLGDMLADAVDMACTETVDRNGKPAKSTAWDRGIPRMQWHLSKILSHQIDQEAAKAIKELNADAKAKVRQQIAAAVAAQLAK
jgi:hypothetical protein